MSYYLDKKTLNPVGELAVIAMDGCEDIAARVDYYLTEWRKDYLKTQGIDSCSFLVRAICPRFTSGEAKGQISESIRGHDLFIICDPFNYGVTYKMYGLDMPMSPDDHFQDLKRIISAAGGRARRITVIMPMLYEGRQHRRVARESLDCASALQELVAMGVHDIITFDAHDARVQNAVPLTGFDDVKTTYQMIKALVRHVPEVKIDRENLVIISPDEGGMQRCIYYSSVLGLDLGMFYKRRDYTTVVNGRNPIVSHEYLGCDVEGRDVIIIDDIIASGDSMLDIAERLRTLKARRVYLFATFGLFTEGLRRFDDAFKQGMIEKVFTTNLVYRSEELKTKSWYVEVDMSKYIAYIIDTLNFDRSMSDLLNPIKRINKLLGK
ncbi:MAG: ribose-phosphate pyrophosphokinase [Clostridia bacterium]|nr:ribose-phosphate pyrophosphokinase [Clostridia bacterium]MDR3643884.1 ribose-phosphate pyrophosphokinase [Clostridia bacterium]